MRNSCSSVGVWVSAFSLVLLITAPVLACLWDYDTLAEERRQFPSALELMTGKFLRHSPEFYEWRIADREKKMNAGASKPRTLRRSCRRP